MSKVKRYGDKEARIKKFLASEKMLTSFFSKIEKGNDDSCWEWKASKRSGSGYGQFGIDGYAEYAHRLSWVIRHGIPKGRLFLCHTCDNPACVNPSHLFLGSQKDNMMDCSRKNRTLKGEKHPKSNLTEKTVIQIKSDRARGMSWKQLNKKYNIAIWTIRSVFTKNWQHIQEVQI